MLVRGLFAVLMLSAGVQAAEDEPASRPNVIFILADDLGWGDLGCYGHPHIRTPNLDRLARQGTLFTEFYVNGSVCSPTRAAFMTGQYPARNRIHGHFATHAQNQARGMPNWLDPRVTLLPRLLKQAGYATAHYGKWHLGSGRGAPDPGAYGFDEHRTLNSNGPAFGQERDEHFRANSTGLFVDEAVRFIEQHPDRSFYINIWTLVPHATLHPTPEQLEKYARFAPARSPYHGATQIYYAAVTGLDEQLGTLFRRLDELGLAENTIVLFSSDNGPEDIHIRNASHSGVGSPGPFRGRKRSLYEGGVRVPLIVRWPGHVPAGRVEDESITSAVDLLPTLCTLAGVEVPEDYRGDGEDLSDIWLGASRPRKGPLHWEWRFRVAGDTIHQCPMLSIRDGRWKLLMNPDRGRVELYDIPRDPTEVNNLAAGHPDVVERLAANLLEWQGTLPEGPVEPAVGRNTYPWPRATGAERWSE